MYPFELQFCLGVCAGVGWQDHIVALFLVFWGVSILFFTVAAPITLPHLPFFLQNVEQLSQDHTAYGVAVPDWKSTSSYSSQDSSHVNSWIKVIVSPSVRAHVALIGKKTNLTPRGGAHQLLVAYLIWFPGLVLVPQTFLKTRADSRHEQLGHSWDPRPRQKSVCLVGVSVTEKASNWVLWFLLLLPHALNSWQKHKLRMLSATLGSV